MFSINGGGGIIRKEATIAKAYYARGGLGADYRADWDERNNMYTTLS